LSKTFQMTKHLVAAATLLCSVSISFSQPTFTEAASSSGIDINFGNGTFGGGVSFVDFNQDGWDDLSFASGSGDSLQFFLNDQGQYIHIDLNLVDDTSETKQINWVDIDNDGDKDLFVTSLIGLTRLYEQTSPLVFTDLTATAGIEIAGQETWGASWGDLNNDSFLDVFITFRDVSGTIKNELYYNNGNNTFTQSSATSILEDIFDISFCSAIFDYNNDGWQDIYIANDRPLYNNVLYRNNGDGTFTDVSAISGAGISINAMSTTIGDYNNDGWLDIYVTNTFEGNAFLENNGNGTFTDVAFSNGTEFESISWGAVFLDGDNDMSLDLYVSGMISTVLIDTLPSAYYHNDGTGNYTIPSGIGFSGDTAVSFSNAIGDVNNDGYPDIIVTNQWPDNNFVWKNDGGTNNWLKVHLEGTISNRDAIGSWIHIYSGGTVQHRYTLCGEGYLAQNSSSEFFGLGSNQVVDSIVIDWPSGIHDVYTNVAANAGLSIIENTSVNLDVIVVIQGPLEFCVGDSVVLDGGNWSNYFWSNAETGSTTTITASGSYFLNVVTATGMIGISDPVTVLVHDPQAELITQDISCYGEMNGVIDCQLTGPVICTFNWSNSAITEDISGLGAGWYSIMITDDFGCIFIDSAEIIEPAEFVLTTSSTPQVGFNEDGMAIVTTTGGTLPFSYFWNDPLAQSNDTASNLASGWYTVWVIDGNNCSDSSSVFVGAIASLDSESITSGFSIAPNPSSGEIQLTFDPSYVSVDTKVSLYDAIGKLLNQFDVQSEILELKLNVQPGSYLIRVDSSNGTRTTRIIIR
jgi:hypothetical protein